MIDIIENHLDKIYNNKNALSLEYTEIKELLKLHYENQFEAHGHIDISSLEAVSCLDLKSLNMLINMIVEIDKLSQKLNGNQS